MLNKFYKHADFSQVNTSDIRVYHEKCGIIKQKRNTHVKISQLVASLQTSRQQVVFARLVTCCQQL